MANELKPVKYSITINGSKVPTRDLKRVSGISIKYTSTGASNCTITMYDPELTYLGGGSIFKEKVPIIINVSYLGKSTSFKGFLVNIDAEIKEIHTLKLNCMDESYLLDRKKVKKNWGKKKRHQIAAEIFKKYGLKAVIDTSEDKPTEEGTKDSSKEESELTQSEETDMAFLTNLAQQEKYEWLCYVRNGVGYYCKKKLIESPVARLQYRKGNKQIVSFSPSINKVTRRVPVYQQDMNIDDGEQTKVRMTPDYSSTQGITL